MPLDDSDYFKWFNDEITRYRNHEWQLAGYAGALLAFTIYFLTDLNRKQLLAGCNKPFAQILVWVFCGCCMTAEWHTHKQLNQYRAAQEAIRKSQDGESALKIKPKLFRGAVDTIYFAGFQIFIFIAGVVAHFSLAQI